MMHSNRFVFYGILLSISLLTGMLALSTQSAFAAVADKDKKPMNQISKSSIESVKGLKANEKRVIVFYKNNIKDSDVSSLSQKGASVKSKFDKMRAVVAHVDSTKLKDILTDPNVARVVDDQIVTADLSVSVPHIGANIVQASGITGKGTKVCIVDTGVDDTHPALNPLVAEINYVKLVGGNPTSDATDDHGHGTHVAGIIASKDATYRGVAPGSSLMAAKVLDSTGSGFSSDVASGINWCVANGAKVINLSLGGGLYTGTCDGNIDAMAVNSAVAAGVTVLVASGNSGTLSQVSSPACASGAIAVGAVDNSDARTAFSNEGTQLAVVAPGVSIKSLNAPFKGGGFVSLTGTSMATPHVAGLASLILDKNSNLNQVQVRNAILNNALDLGVSGFDTIYGNGRIQAINSVNSVLPDSSTVSTPTGSVTIGTNSGGIASSSSILESSLPIFGKPAMSFPNGFVGFTVNGVTPGGITVITLNYSTPIPAGVQYWKVIGTTWVNATSILGDNNGDSILTLNILDNGPFDSNPTLGVISDPGAPAIPLPIVSINNASMLEGNSGTTNMVFQASLSKPSTSTVTVDFNTVDGSAISGTDYSVSVGTITFSPGQTIKTILIPIHGDYALESDETFTIVLTNPTNAALSLTAGIGIGTIQNDDLFPEDLNTYCDGKTISQLITENVYNLIDNRSGVFGTRISGTSGNDLILLSDTGNHVQAKDGNDCIIGGASKDVISGGLGDDQIYAGAGNDHVTGRAGFDMIFGGLGNDVLSGGLGNDSVYGDNGDDIVLGREDDDSLSGGAGNDYCSGEAGNDIADFSCETSLP
ncbi:MAG: hypothetical protein EB149_01635 [Thaumarchaeota archaeon]|nr:hypothetical protein [Nitrososphaeria archaeon]NDF24681.1 hypothetical protein [Nitrososphaerota archaeon]NDF26467.1 hypothetical protein [Nitrosopumilaceae archaeon]